MIMAWKSDDVTNQTSIGLFDYGFADEGVCAGAQVYITLYSAQYKYLLWSFRNCSSPISGCCALCRMMLFCCGTLVYTG